MSIKKNKNQLMISILVGLAIFAVSYQFVIKQYEENQRQRAEIQQLKQGIGVNKSAVDENNTVFVVTKKEIAEGDIIKEEDVELKDIKIHMNGAFTSTEKIIGKPALKPIKAGMPITTALVDVEPDKEEAADTTNSPREGFRAVAATVASNRMAPFLKDGAYIDIYTAEDTIQAKNVRVIKILDQEGSSSGKLILFEIMDQDVGAFINAMTKDKLIPVQRNPYDTSGYEFSFDPFKYASYSITNEDLGELSSMDEIPEPVRGESGRIIPVKRNTEKASVEVIMGNKVTTVDF